MCVCVCVCMCVCIYIYFCLFFFKEHKKNKPENNKIGHLQEGGEGGRDMGESDTSVSKPCYRVLSFRKYANGLYIQKVK